MGFEIQKEEVMGTKRKVKYQLYERVNPPPPPPKGPYDWVTKEGLFLGWGLELHESCETTCSYTVALVERPDGGVDTPEPSRVKFMEPDHD